MQVPGRATYSPVHRSALPQAISALVMAAALMPPDEYYVIESTNPKIQGLDGSVFSFVEYLFELTVVN